MIHIKASVARDNNEVYASLIFQIDRMSEVETLSHSAAPSYLYNGRVDGLYDLRQNDYLVDLSNTDPVTGQAKAYQIINEPESFDLDQHMEFQCMRADRAALTRSA